MFVFLREREGERERERNIDTREDRYSDQELNPQYFGIQDDASTK